MILLDVNILVRAHHEGSPDHANYKRWLADLLRGASPFSVTDLVFSGFLRIITHPAIFDPPGSLGPALELTAILRANQNFVPIQPGPRHWSIFENLCVESKARGNLIADAFHAAIAIENGCTWVTTDRDFRRFKGLKVKSPFDS